MARPKLKEEDKKISLHITLTKDQVRLLKEMGNGNASEAVRKLVDDLMIE